MPKVFGWAKKLTGRSSSKTTGQAPVADGEPELSPNSSGRNSPEKNSEQSNEIHAKIGNGLNNKSSPNDSQYVSREPSPEKQFDSVSKYSKEKRRYSDRRPSVETRPERKPSPEKRHHSDRRPSPEKRLSPEKQNTGFAKRFTSFRILSLDRKNTRKKSKSKSPDPDLISGDGAETPSDSANDRNVEKSPSPITENTINTKTDEGVINYADQLESRSKTKDTNLTNEKVQIRSNLDAKQEKSDESSQPGPEEACVPVDPSCSPRMSRVPGRQSISEKLYGEVIKEFDKIRTTKPKTNRNVNQEISPTDLKDQREQDGEVINQNNCTSDKEANIRQSDNQCLNNNLINSRFTVSAVKDFDPQIKSSPKTIKKDLKAIPEDTISHRTRNTQSSSAASNEDDSLKNYCSSLGQDVSKRVPLVSPEVSDSDLSDDETNDKVFQSVQPVSEHKSTEITQIGSIENSLEPFTDISDVNNLDSKEGDRTYPPLIIVESPVLVNRFSKAVPCNPCTIENNLSEESCNLMEDKVPSEESQQEVLSDFNTVSLSQSLVNGTSCTSEQVIPVECTDESLSEVTENLSSPKISANTTIAADNVLDKTDTEHELSIDQMATAEEEKISSDMLSVTPNREESVLVVEDEIATKHSESKIANESGHLESGRYRKEDEISPSNHSTEKHQENDDSSEIKTLTDDLELLIAKADTLSVSPKPGSPVMQCSNNSTLKSSIPLTESREELSKVEPDELYIQNETCDKQDMTCSKEDISNSQPKSIDINPSDVEEFNNCEKDENKSSEKGSPELESMIENEEKFKEEILALIDKSFDSRKTIGGSDEDNICDLQKPKDMVEPITNPDDDPTVVSKSLNSYDGKTTPPVAPRRLSRGSSAGSTSEISQHSSVSETTVQSTFLATETSTPKKGVNESVRKISLNQSLNESCEDYSFEEGGGSLPGSPSIPRRKKKSHPVPASRSFHTLNATSGSSKSNGVSDEKKLESNSNNNPPPRPPMPSVICSLPPLPESISTIPSKSVTPIIKDLPKAQKDATNSQNNTAPKEHRKASLNPFDSDEGEEEEALIKDEKKQCEKNSLNPFDSDEDESEELSIPPIKDKSQDSAPGYNPFDEDDEEDETSPRNETRGTKHTPGDSVPSVRRILNESISSISSMTSNRANESCSTNPFDDDDDEEDLNTSCSTEPLTRKCVGRQSLAVKAPSPFQRDNLRASLPSSGMIPRSKRKRQAPLPPGHKPGTISASSTPLPPRHQSALWRGDSSTSLNQSPKKDSTSSLRRNHTSCSTLSLTSPRRAPPPRPPPPKAKSISMAQLN